MMLAKTIAFYFRQPSLDSVSIPELQRAIKKYPYSSALQLLLLKKQQLEKDPGFAQQWEVANLFYGNPYLLQSILNPPAAAPAASAVPAPANSRQEAIPHPAAAPEPAAGLPSETVPAPEAAAGTEAAAPETTPDPEPLPASKTAPGPEAVAEPAPGPSLRSDLLAKESPIPIPSLKDIGPQTDNQPLFEPYHTIDYFASQGIKLGNEIQANDRLGRQLKSFTEWIRTMKKLPQENREQQLMASGSNESIAAMAEGSVQHREVLTETMAEVLVKQGNNHKAIEIYQKLSLAYPDKSAYFAARIETLKQH